MIEARIVADSINKYGSRLTTFVCTYNRWILAEVNTHRMLSRNTASSRAIPTEKLLQQVLDNPAVPVSWTRNQKGMSAKEDISQEDQGYANGVWSAARFNAVDSARHLLSLGVHKQHINRIVEPFLWTTSVITATDWGNFFNLRCNKEAQPEFRVLATRMLEAYQKSDPQWKADGGFHLPFADKYIPNGITQENLLKIATARCARVSYLNFEGDISFEKDYALHDTLVANGHCSPLEHCAYALPPEAQPLSNFTGGWFQYRKMFRNENRKEFDPNVLLNQ